MNALLDSIDNIRILAVLGADEYRFRCKDFGDNLQPCRLFRNEIFENFHEREWKRVCTFIVVPVSTKSTIASARPKAQAASTEPETNLIPGRKKLVTR